MIWKKGDFWNFVIRRMARSQGFLDPVTVFSRLQRFSKPSEVWVPTELLRSGAILQARGLMNSQAIQHNLDWIWPYWVHRQFNPSDVSFIPRAFSMTHINLTHRNWTAVGIPDFEELPIVDPRGLVTPFYDGWSLDGWLIYEKKNHLTPSSLLSARQSISWASHNISIETAFEREGDHFSSKAEVVVEEGFPVCKITYTAVSRLPGWMAVSLRPYNPEGISFINDIQRLSDSGGWKVNSAQEVKLEETPEKYLFSNYSAGDVFSKVLLPDDEAREVRCDVGMSTAAALYALEPGNPREIKVRVPLLFSERSRVKKYAPAAESWKDALSGHCRLEIPDKHFQFLYESALQTLILHSPEDVYPGPFTYKRFWFRDAAFILYAMLCVGLKKRVERTLDRFAPRQTPTGHFLSQDGEWDSNGQALWILLKFCRLTGQKPKDAWRPSIYLGGQWIKKKRLSKEKNAPHAGLLPAGFSAEHLGPNDFYYWDDFWGVAGLRAAAELLRGYGDAAGACDLEADADDFMISIDKSLENTSSRLGHKAMPASPYRRMDAGSIGSIAVGYPLQLWHADDPRLLETAHFLIKKCFLNGGFYQEISHSGINAYLTLEVAQVLLRAGDPCFIEPVRAIASLATSTGQWPEAIHPRTNGGCMGDGQHVWAAAEWVLMMRNLFIREEEKKTLVLCGGILPEWLQKKGELFFGPAPTDYGTISVQIKVASDTIRISWDGGWHGDPPKIEIHLPGRKKITVPEGQTEIEIPGEVR